MINDNYIKKVPIEYLQMENANGFFDIFKSIFEAKIENICIISEDEISDDASANLRSIRRQKNIAADRITH